MLKIIASFTIKVLVSLIFILLVLKKINLNEVFETLRSVKIIPYFTAALISLANNSLFVGSRWKILLGKSGSEINILNLSGLALISQSINTIIPGNFMGDIIRAFKLSNDKLSKEFLLASVLTDRLVGFMGLSFLSIFGFFLGYQIFHNSNLYIYYLIIILGLIFVTSTLWSNIFTFLIIRLKKQLGEFMQKILFFFDSVAHYRNERKIIICALLVSIIIGLNMISIFFLLVKALSINISYYSCFLVIPVIMVLSMLPVTIGGLGIREYASVLFFASVGVSNVGALSISLLFFSIYLIISVIGLLLYFTYELKSILFNKDDNKPPKFES